MSELCWLNGQVMPLSEAKVSVEDRGFLFADGVYEAMRIYGGKPFGLEQHLDRLERSCEGIELTLPLEKPELAAEIEGLVRRAELHNGLVYLQLTRGPAPRSHVFPAHSKPTLFFYVRQLAPVLPARESKPYTLLSVPDERWNRCWIKSIALLANTLARNAADRAGADEAIFIHDEMVMEGASSNIYMVNRGTLITAPLGNRILGGVTRAILLDCAREVNIPVEERLVRLAEAQHADEVLISSSIREVVWVSKWDNIPVGGGACGPIASRLHEAYQRRVQQVAG